jgi:hypothetical protein
VFPFLQSVIAIKASGVSADNATMAAGATATVANSVTGQIRIQVPNLGMDVTTLSSNTGFTQSANGRWLAQVGASMDHTVLGMWAAANSSGGVPTHSSAFATGFVTPPAAVPASGTAVYSDIDNVIGLLLMQTGGAALKGDGSLNVNFGSHTVTGSFTNMEATNAQSSQVAPWNNVSVHWDPER